ncbi:MAG: AraC family transcriptional regulator [Nocardioides sp.]|uniref:helix-turn-helix domain-containing protein n=1 Tax=Nocardioides sp. TaxID=35761 RepID=UPI0039E6CE49
MSMTRSANGESDCRPVAIHTYELHAAIGPVSYDCIRIVVPRAGSSFVFGEFGRWVMNVGDVLAVGPAVLCGVEPKGRVVTTTLYLDRDYLVDQLFWRHVCQLTDRIQAGRVFDAWYPGPALLLRLGEDRTGLMGPSLDELAAFTTDGIESDRFYRVQSLVFSVLDVLLPHLRATRPEQPSNGRVASCPLSRGRRFGPLRVEARAAAGLLRESPDRSWTLDDLARMVHLSQKQLSRVFVEAYGKTPLAYLTMLRVERMAELLREDDLSVAAAGRSVGWSSRSRAAEAFRHCLGVTPQQYRAQARHRAA